MKKKFFYATIIIAALGFTMNATSCDKTKTCKCTDSSTSISVSYETEDECSTLEIGSLVCEEE